MGSHVDERIVSMQFDNKQFESGVQTSMASLDKLQEKLSFKDAGDGLKGLTAAANRVDFGGLSINIEGVTAKFTAFQSFVHGMFESLGSDVMNFGKRLVNSLTFDQISSGWQKYSQMATSVASIIAATGDSQTEVYGQLGKLNWFADATSYSLTQMTSAYSKFAAAGVDAEESMQAIMGLATASSRAGISASDPRFNNVLYNVSQAMGMGYMSTLDWRSLENANIATKEFKQYLIDAAVAAGELEKTVDGVFTKSGKEVTADNLRNSLSEKWLTKQVMLSGFGIYGGFVDEVYEYAVEKGISAEQAMQELKESVEDCDDETRKFGYAAMRSAQETKTWQEAVDATKDAVSTLWMDIFQDIIGNYEEAKEVWGSVAEFLYEAFATPLEKVEEILSTWKLLGGRTIMLDGLSQSAENLGKIIDAVREAFKNLFPAINASTILDISRKFRDFAKDAAPSETTLNKITTAFSGVAAIFDLGKTIIGKVWEIVKNFFSTMSGGSKNILDVAAAIGEWISKMVEAIESSELFNGIFETLGDVTTRVAEFLRLALGGIWSDFSLAGGGAQGVINAVLGVIEDMGRTLLTIIQDLTGWDLSGWFTGLYEVISWLKDKLSSIVELITGDKDLSVWETIKKIFSDLNDVLGPLVEKVGSFFSSLVDGAKNFLDKINFSTIVTSLQTVWDWIKSTGTKVWEWIKEFVSSLKGVELTDITDIFGGVGVGVGGLTIFAVFRKVQDLITTIKGFAGVGTKISEFLGGLRTSLIELSNAAKTSLNVSVIEKIAVAVIMLAGAMKLISTIPVDQMVFSLGAVSTILAETVGSMAIFSQLDLTKKMNSIATGMILVSVSVVILAGAVKMLAELDWAQLAKGLLGVTVLLGEVGVFVNNVRANDLAATGFGIMEMAVAIAILSSSVEKLGAISFDQLIVGLGAVGILLTEIGVFVNKILPEDLIATGLGMIEIGAAMAIMTSIAEKFASFTLDQLVAGLGAVGVLLGEIAIFTEYVDPQGLISAGLGIIEIALALKILAGIAEQFAAMETEALVTAVGAIGVIMAEIVGLAWGLNEFGGSSGELLAAGAALILVGAGLAIVAGVVKSLASIPFENLVQGVAALGAVILELGVALKLAEGSLLGAASLLVVAVALNALIPIIALLAALPAEAVGKALLELAGALAILILAGAGAELVGAGLFILAGALIALGAAFLAAGVGLSALSAGIATFATLSMGAIEAFVVGIGVVISSILTLLPSIATALAASLVVFIATLAGGAATILASVVALGAAILDALIELVPKVVELVVTTLSAILAGLIELVPQVLELVGEIIMGILELLLEAVPKVIEIIFAALTSIIEGLTEFIPKVVQLAVACLKALIEAIVELIPTIVDAALQILTGILQAIADNLPDIIQAGVDIVVAFVEGIGTAIPQLIEAAYQMMIDLINGMADAIENNTETLLDAIDRLIWAIIDAAVAVLTHAVENFKTAGKNLMNSGLVQGIKDKWEAVKTAVKTAITAAKNKITEKVNEWLDAGKTLLTNVIDGFKKKVTDIKDSISNIINTAKQVIVDKVTEWIQMGKDLIQGFINGIFSKKSSVSNAVEDTMENATKTGKKPWLMKSPSRLTRQWGIYVDEGFILGIEDKADAVADSTEDMAQGAINALTGILGKDLDFGDNLEPVITPVMDLTEIQNGVDDMNSMFGDRSMSMYGASDVSRLMSGGRVDLTQQAISQLQDAINRMAGRTGTTNNNTFNIQGDDPEAIALEVSRILQTDVERTGAVWA